MKNRMFSIRMKKITSIITTILLTASLITPVFAEELLPAVLEDTITAEDIVSSEIPADEDGIEITADADVKVDDTLTVNTDDISAPEKAEGSSVMDGFEGFYTEEMAEEARRILSIDPGVICGPNNADTSKKTRNDSVNNIMDDEDAIGITPDGISQTQNACTWPEEQLNLEERNFVRGRVKAIVANLITDDMSDIEKYWTLANWETHSITYKYVGQKAYDHDTSHGSYCALRYGYAVCQGYGLLYSHLCHEAGLPCDEVLLDRNGANHLINVLPNINGHAYYVDVTNNMFLFSDDTAFGFDHSYRDVKSLDAPRTIDCDSNAFVTASSSLYAAPYTTIPISSTKYTTYDQFYHYFIARDRQYSAALSESYVEKGSGVSETHYADYASYALQNSDNTGDWRYDDFSIAPKNTKAYEEEINASETIPTINVKNLTVSGLKNAYYYDGFDVKGQYLAALKEDIVLTYNGRTLVYGEDYWLDNVSLDTHTGMVQVSGWGDYYDFNRITFNINPNTESPNPGRTEITVNVEVNVGDIYNLTEEIGKNDFISLTESDMSVATVAKYGNGPSKYIGVKGEKKGSATATLETSGITYHLNITVVEPEPEPAPEKPQVSKNITVFIGETYNLSAEINTYEFVSETVEKQSVAIIGKYGSGSSKYIGIFGSSYGVTSGTLETADTIYNLSITVKQKTAIPISVEVAVGSIYNLSEVTNSYDYSDCVILDPDVATIEKCNGTYAQYLGVKGLKVGTTKASMIANGVYEITITVKAASSSSPAPAPNPDPAPNPSPAPGPSPSPSPSPSPAPSPGPSPSPEPSKTQVNVNAEVNIGTVYNLSADIGVYDFENYSVADTSIAKIDKYNNIGTQYIGIQGIKVGNTTATVETTDAIYNINITTKNSVTSTLDVTVEENQWINVEDVITASNNYGITIANNDVVEIGSAKFENNKYKLPIKGVKTGKTSVLVTVDNSTIKINVNVIPATKHSDTDPAEKPKSENDLLLVTGGKITNSDYAKLPTDGKNYKVTYSNKNIATISDKGIVQGKKVGFTTATITRPSGTTVVNITVKNPVFKAKSFVKNTTDDFNVGFDDEGLDVTYTSNKPNIASVDDKGNVTIKARGNATITAETQKKKYKVNVKAFDPEITGAKDIYLNKKTTSLKIKNGTGKTQWSSSDSSVITVDKNGKIKAVSKGTAVITAVNNNRTMTMTINTFNVPKFEKKTYVTNIDTPIDLSIIKDDDMTDVVYSVKDTRIATVTQDGIVTPIKAGTVAVMAKAHGITYKTVLKIYNPSISGKNVIKVGKILGLGIKGGTKGTEWSSSDTSIATIDAKGKIKGVSAGKVTITAINTGKTLTKEITVE